MIDYYFQDNLRWSLGWETPNQAGAFLATLLPLCWLLSVCLWRIVGGASSVSSVARTDGPHGGGPSLPTGIRVVGMFGLLVVIAGECWLWWALAKTYSRGAWVGLGCGVVVWGLFQIWRWFQGRAGPLGPPRTGPAAPNLTGAPSGRALPWIAIMLRVAVVATCLLVSNFSARLAPDYTLSDRSALNRVDLWKGGLELVAASPLRGWGWGESGAAYMQWTQPLDRTEGYKSMVNSYLTVAVEAGLPVFALLLAGMLVPLAMGARLARNASGARPAIALGLSACWATWLGCLFFSNLWIISKLWIVPGVAAGLLTGWSALSLTRFGVGRDRLARRESPSTLLPDPVRPAVTPYLGTAFATALVMGLALWLAGSYFARATPLKLSRESTGIVTLVPRGKPASGWLEVYPDAAVLGESYGHELRRWLQVGSNPPALRIQSSVTPDFSAEAAKPAVVFGGQAGRVSLEGRKVCLVHPAGMPPETVSALAEGSRVVLAGIDPTGGRYTWAEWADQRGATIKVNEGLAADVRLRWPDVVEDFGRR